MADNARGIHVSPGIYTREIDMTYAVRSLGITTLGVAGETLKGPAFQVMDIANWREFQDVFGGTSVEKFKGSQYPKYELPYIAKSYLSESEQLKVVRILGLSGYNAGPAWLVTANGQAVALIRSRGSYKPFEYSSNDDCTCEPSKYDTLKYFVGEKKADPSWGDCLKHGYNLDALQIEPYIPISSDGDECTGYKLSGDLGNMSISQANHGRFKLVGWFGSQYEKTFSGTTGGSAADFKAKSAAYVTTINDPESTDAQKKAATDNLNTSAEKLGITGIVAAIKAETDATAKNQMKIAYSEYKRTIPGYFEYPVSLNPFDKEYILNVLGTKPYDGDSYIFVESLYDVALDQGIAEGVLTEIDSSLAGFQVYYTADYCHHEPVSGIISMTQASLRRKHIGMRFLANKQNVDDVILCVAFDYNTGKPIMAGMKSGDSVVANTAITTDMAARQKNKFSDMKADEQKEANTIPALFTVEKGQIYTVRQYTTADGKRNYYYAYYTKESVNKFIDEKYVAKDKALDPTNLYGNLLYGGTKGMDSEHNFDKIGAKKQWATLVLNMSDGLYYRMNDESAEAKKDIHYVELDLNDYKSAFRYASTPWIVSNLKGDYEHVEINKLFRFHTISDGNGANYEVKVSIENIRPDEGVFDVLVRRVDDSDEQVIPLERFGRCSMIPGTANYIGFKIGTFDGVYESKSKYITVEVNDSTAAKMSVPAGFLGYPIPKYNGLPISGSANSNVTFPTLAYNRFFDPDVKNRKQYFGLSSWKGVDIDNFTFKGYKTYIDLPEFKTPGFHLDSRLDKTNGGLVSENITVDGESGYEFESVSVNSNTTTLPEPPVIGTEDEMYGSIFQYVNLRKFTVYFYGGFDGWDDYRDERTIGDEYKMSQYRGYINQGSGEGYSFNRIKDPELLQLNQNGITSDWYAYLSGIRQFANPEATDINVFATPGIDYVNNKLLVEEAIDMIEEERADSIYVITTPDKPKGSGDYVDEMYTPDEAVGNLEDSEIDSNYSCTYYPWVKYLDQDNSQYIYLPATKDAVRNFAQTDNVAYPWFAPAGVERGNVDCVRAHFITKLGDEDVLYEGRINPIKTFAQDGPKIWGQKNLQINESQLNRIAVRRLLLRMRKLIAISCIGLIFEPNDPTTKQSFLSTVTPIMDSIRSNRGISDYRIEINDTIESRERRELPVKIYFKPYNALEYITIDFILTPEGVSFDDI